MPTVRLTRPLKLALAAALATGTLGACNYYEKGMPGTPPDRHMPAVRVTGPGLTADCPSLAREKAFTYETSLSQLCSADIVYVLENWGGQPHRGTTCNLGQFTPVEFAR